jgi:hypothetical protein
MGIGFMWELNAEPGDQDAPDVESGRDPVPHYQTPGGIEAIDYIRSLGILIPFSTGNIIKYLTRAGRKEGEDALKDLYKARTYLNFIIDQLEEENSSGGD